MKQKQDLSALRRALGKIFFLYAVFPKPNDWCLCAHCINPEMKLETLAHLTKDASFHWEDGKSFECIDGPVERMKATNIGKTIMSNKWQSGSFSKK